MKWHRQGSGVALTVQFVSAGIVVAAADWIGTAGVTASGKAWQLSHGPAQRPYLSMVLRNLSHLTGTFHRPIGTSAAR
eukprot:819201-Prymnesium_polylepis.1